MPNQPTYFKPMLDTVSEWTCLNIHVVTFIYCLLCIVSVSKLCWIIHPFKWCDFPIFPCWEYLQKRVVRTNFDFFLQSLVDTSDGGILVPECIIYSVVSASVLTWFIIYIYYIYVHVLLKFTFPNWCNY